MCGWAKFSHPWLTGNHLSLDFYGGLRERADTMNGFNERSWEFTPGVGTWLGRHGRLREFVSLFQMQSDVAGETLGPDNEDRFFRIGFSAGYDTRDSWRDSRTGWKNEIEIIRSAGDGSFWTMSLDLGSCFTSGAAQNRRLSDSGCAEARFSPGPERRLDTRSGQWST